MRGVNVRLVFADVDACACSCPDRIRTCCWLCEQPSYVLLAAVCQIAGASEQIDRGARLHIVAQRIDVLDDPSLPFNTKLISNNTYAVLAAVQVE